MYTLYYWPGSCATASHILLEEAGATYDAHAVALAKGEQRGEAYRKVNPHGKVPALAVDGHVITQNAAILPFIASRFPDANLTPSDPVAYADCMALVGWLTSAAHPAFGLALHPERPLGGAEGAEPAVAAIRENGRRQFWACLEELDARVTGREWMMGDQFTFADPYALVFYGWGKRIDMPVGDLAAFTAFKDRMTARPAVRRVLEKENSPLLAAA
jgi:glutathione S-transferase